MRGGGLVYTALLYSPIGVWDFTSLKAKSWDFSVPEHLKSISSVATGTGYIGEIRIML